MSQVWARDPDPATVRIDDDFLVFDGTDLTLLAGTAAAVFQEVDGVSDVDQIAARLARRFAAPPAEVATGAIDLLGTLQNAGVVTARKAPGARFRCSRDVGEVDLGESVVLGDLASGRRFVLEGTAADLWRAICTTGTIVGAVDVVVGPSTDDADRSAIESDAEAFVEELVAADLLRPVT